MKILYHVIVAGVVGVLVVSVVFDASAAENRASSAVIVKTPQVHRQSRSQTPAISTKVNNPQVNFTINHSAITGTSLRRPTMATGTIGGAAKTRTGVINGTDIYGTHLHQN